jgi:hypothetical protein
VYREASRRTLALAARRGGARHVGTITLTPKEGRV